MTDLTVLVAPNPLYPTMNSSFTFGRKQSQVAHPPIMVTLERDLEGDENNRWRGSSTEGSSSTTTSPPRRSRPLRREYDEGLLSPPINTWKSPDSRFSRHRPTRSRSAPPGKTAFEMQQEHAIAVATAEAKAVGAAAVTSPSAYVSQPVGLDFPPLRASPKRSFTTPRNEPIRPPPPLLRPTTFWRKTQRSGVTGASYSPSSHLVRRSTFLAAGLTLDAPVHDLTALCVESRVGFIVIPPDQNLH
ncbi:hypothetical protein BDN72DRAFT_107067 [Pluteus cervinus]|uniref:Uncharacterized protein n=1 Tax=Pluteus cervinus TaxID=181527 RepID=A0ACD3ANR3_9AGAR|nr:hypothetical protein BDN72DRAFT_107067 [Pluteus cervinus]